MLQRSVANLRAWRSRRCSKEQKKEQSITSRSAHTSVVQAGPANHSANACKLANADQELTFHLSQHASKHLPHWFPPDSPLILTNPGVWWTSWFPHALFDVWADPALRDRGPCAVSMKAIKKLNSCHGQNRPCIHFFFFILSIGKMTKWAVSGRPDWCSHSKRQSPCQSVRWLN